MIEEWIDHDEGVLVRRTPSGFEYIPLEELEQEMTDEEAALREAVERTRIAWDADKAAWTAAEIALREAEAKAHQSAKACMVATRALAALNEDEKK